MKRFLSIACAMLLGCAALLANANTAHAFSSEAPVSGHPWYHAQITREAPKTAGFSFWIPVHYAILSGGEARVRYTFSSTNTVPKPVKITLGDRVSRTTLEWPVSVP